MLSANRGPKENLSSSARWMLFVALAALAISTRPEPLKSQDAQDKSARLYEKAPLAQSSPSVPGLSSARPGSAVSKCAARGGRAGGQGAGRGRSPVKSP